MAYLLHIESAITGASVCLSHDDELLSLESTEAQKDTAAWLHLAIRGLLGSKGLKPADLAAVSVGMGPGSYTGLRVGYSAAKGLCYALRIPLIAIGTLDAMFDAGSGLGEDFRIPLIDARRMEVFTAAYRRDGLQLVPPSNLILDAASFQALLEQGTVAFYGSGAAKFSTVCTHSNAQFPEVRFNASHLIKRAWERFQNGEFTDLAYSEPYYGKDFHSLAKYSL